MFAATITTLLTAAATTVHAGPELKADGAFGFPQAGARVLADTEVVRVSVANDGEHLYVQAILWTDGDDSVGETADGRPIGDNSVLRIDADADGKATGHLDRDYSLNPWPVLPGLHYQVLFGDKGSSHLTADSKGRGAISYVDVGEGKRVRVDSFLVPLAEIKRDAGQRVRIAYWGSSAEPKLRVNSVGFTSEKPYYAVQLPREAWHEITLAPGATKIDVQAVPEGRGTIAVEAKEARAHPEVGTVPPEVAAGDWINWSGAQPPSLASLKGKVAVVEFWATWCGPCVAGIPHLNEIHDAYKGRGLVILSLTDQNKVHVEEFMQNKPMHYTVGVKSQTAQDYGVSGIPHAFVVGRDGKLVWHGHPAEPDFETAIKQALGAD